MDEDQIMAEPVSTINRPHNTDDEEQLQLRDVENEDVSRESADADNEIDRRVADSQIFNSVHRGSMLTGGQESDEQVANRNIDALPVAFPTISEADQSVIDADPIRSFQASQPEASVSGQIDASPNDIQGGRRGSGDPASADETTIDDGGVSDHAVGQQPKSDEIEPNVSEAETASISDIQAGNADFKDLGEDGPGRTDTADGHGNGGVGNGNGQGAANGQGNGLAADPAEDDEADEVDASADLDELDASSNGNGGVGTAVQ